MLLLAALLSLSIFTLPTVPEALETPEDRALYLAEHYWDNTLLSDTLIENHPEEYEQFLVDFLSILPIIEPDKRNELLAPLFAYSTPLLRSYLCNKESPVFDDSIYNNVLNYLSDKNEKLCLEFHYKENCDACESTLEQMDISPIFQKSIAEKRLSIHIIKTSNEPNLILKNTKEEVLSTHLKIEEIEKILIAKLH